jgi:hypothetical protein
MLAGSFLMSPSLPTAVSTLSDEHRIMLWRISSSAAVRQVNADSRLRVSRVPLVLLRR